MTLIYDRTADAGDKPGLHALIVGVSDYPDLPGEHGVQLEQHYGMRQLSCAAGAAFGIYEWLLDRCDRLPAPLATCRVLLAASEAETAANNDLQALCAKVDRPIPDAFMKAAKAWREDACRHRDGVTLFYFAGHGIQRVRQDHAMLLEGFGNGIGGALENAADTGVLYNGMAPVGNFKDIARSQLYFVDACRELPRGLVKYEAMPARAVFNVSPEGVDDRVAAIFYSAVPGAKAYGTKGRDTVFSRTLLWCLTGGAGMRSDVDDTWQVSVHSLIGALAKHSERAEAEMGMAPEIQVVTSVTKRDLVVHRLDGPPKVDVVLEVAPAGAHKSAAVTVTGEDAHDHWKLKSLKPHPFRGALPAGMYHVSVRLKSPYASPPSLLKAANPPRTTWRLRIPHNPVAAALD